MSKGYVYIMTTAIDGLIKIGRSADWNKRCQADLESNGYKNATALQTYFVVKVDNQEEIESIMHDIFRESRVAKLELFALDKDRAKRVLSKMGTQVYPEINVKEQKNPEYMISTAAKKYSFKDLNIPVGSILTFKKDDKITVKTADDVNQVIYNNTQMHISKAAWYLFDKFDGFKYNGFVDFKYNGTILKDIKSNIFNKNTLAFCDVPVGSELVLIFDPTYKVITIDDKNKVKTPSGEICSISKAADSYIRPKTHQKGGINGFAEFMYNGTRLWDISAAKRKSM